MSGVPAEEERATCKNCGHAIIWHYDRDPETGKRDPYGFWYDAAHMTEACGGPDGDPVDDLWHEPEADARGGVPAPPFNELYADEVPED